ncbi:class I SAM-dependent methyltransferase [Sphingomonas sp. TREG-RG-20F-R18-01]|uniref:class I SAM-dependent methyltransferase n=1 Tax=Sphingomonas sp. TREG-RG-20F-R18-01 TaxID=2914982 RepID=UPI001F565B9F|nr:class I SAM-dependent methyltransferase [Sphingomonas sp. TREG-RG-20F-R18-01]
MITDTGPTTYDFVTRDACPGCGSPDVRKLYETPFSEGGIGTFVRDYYGVDPSRLADGRYRLERCRACGLTFQGDVGGNALLSDLYTYWVEEPGNPDQDIASYREDINAIPLSRDAHEIMAAASFLGKPLKDLRTLDYGMGWALWPRIAVALGCQSYGSDLSEPRMEFARHHKVKSVTDDEISTLQFDFINTEQVFEHVIEPLALLRRLKQSLSPGGIVKISVPSGDTADAIITSLEQGTYAGDYASIIPVQPLEHVNTYTYGSLEAMAAAAGLEIVTPGLWHLFAFLRHRNTLALTRLRKVAKELVRPLYQRRDPKNLFVWLRHKA